MTESEKSYCFKVENKYIVKSGCKKRMWRSLKQILTAERVLPWPSDAVLCKLTHHKSLFSSHLVPSKNYQY